MTDRFSRHTNARSLGVEDPRGRAQGFTVSGGLRKNAQGELVLSLDERGPFYVNQRGELALRVTGGLFVAPGSPNALQVKMDENTVLLSDVGLSASLRASGVMNDSSVPGKTVADALNYLNSYTKPFMVMGA